MTTVHTAMASDIPKGEFKDVEAALGILQLPFSIKMERWLLRRSQIVTAVSPSVAESLGQYGYATTDVATIPNGISAREFSFAPRERSAFILYVGRLGPRKGLFDLLHAHAILAREFKMSLPLRVIGEGPLRNSLVRLSDRLGTSALVQFKGFVDRSEVLRNYSAAAVVVIPSHLEGFPTVLLEAWATGAPVVAARSPGIRDAVKDGTDALMYPPGDSRALASCLQEVLSDASLSRTLAARGQSMVFARFTWEKLAPVYLNLYANLINSPPT
jgi:glycosyltransferase involved in cell wall biosynthesis